MYCCCPFTVGGGCLPSILFHPLKSCFLFFVGNSAFRLVGNTLKREEETLGRDGDLKGKTRGKSVVKIERLLGIERREGEGGGEVDKGEMEVEWWQQTKPSRWPRPSCPRRCFVCAQISVGCW